MARLTGLELRSRLAFDARVIRALHAPTLGGVRGFTSGHAAVSGRVATGTDEEAGMVVIYDVDFNFPMLKEPRTTFTGATARFYLLAGGNYPFTEPQVQFTTRPVPFCTHVQQSTGTVCLGGGWGRSGGSVLLAQLVIHVMRLANLDEPIPNHDTFSTEALAYWRDVLRWRPLNPDLEYPALPSEVTHGVTRVRPKFVVGSSTMTPPRTSFKLQRPSGDVRPSSGFSIRSEVR